MMNLTKIRKSGVYHATRLVKLVGAFVGGILLLISGIFFWIGYSNDFFVEDTTSLLQRLNDTISASPHAAIYVIGGVVSAIVVGSIVLIASMNYIPRGKGQLSWDEYFDDLPWKQKQKGVDTK